MEVEDYFLNHTFNQACKFTKNKFFIISYFSN